MSLMTQWNPVRPISRFGSTTDFDDLFRGLGLRPLIRDFETMPEVRLEVNETDKNYLIKAEIPGVKKEDIEVAVEGNQVSIGAEIKRELQPRKDERTVHSE